MNEMIYGKNEYLRPNDLLNVIMVLFDGLNSSNHVSFQHLFQSLCSLPFMMNCSDMIGVLGGSSQGQMNITRLPVFYNGFPAGTSMMAHRHLTQCFRSHRFARFDFGKEKNIQLYKTERPPDYPIERVTNRHIALFSGSGNDLLSMPADVNRLRKALKVKLMDDYVIPIKDWTHFDFLLSVNAGRVMISRILKLLSMYR